MRGARGGRALGGAEVALHTAHGRAGRVPRAADEQDGSVQAGKLAGIDWRTVGSIVERSIGEKLDPTRLDDLTVIGVDELSFRRRHN